MLNLERLKFPSDEEELWHRCERKPTRGPMALIPLGCESGFASLTVEGFGMVTTTVASEM